MQRHKKLSARILSMALSVAMVATMMPATAFAAEGGSVALGAGAIGTIRSFEKLADRFESSTGEGASKNVYALNVELNTPFEDLDLPDGLTGVVARTTTVSAPAVDEVIPDEDKVVDEDTATDDTVSGNQPASPSDAEEEVKDETTEIKDDDIPLAPEPDEETTVTTTEQEIIPVTWNSDKEYVSDKNDQFIYTAALPEGYNLADGVKLPQIYVAVGNQARAAGDATSVTINGTATGSGASMQAAIAASGVAADAVISLKVTAGAVKEADWNYLRALTAMTSFEIDAALPDADVEGTPYTGTSMPIFPQSIETVTVPQAIEIGGYSLTTLKKLANVNFANATDIGENAFMDTPALQSVSFPKVTSIGTMAFMRMGVSTLKSASFPEATYIGGGAFAGCNQLTNVSLPKVEDIGKEAFFNCTKLATLKLGATPPTVTGAFPDSGCTLGYVGADGNDLTGEALAAAIAAYQAQADANGKWHGLTIVPVASIENINYPTLQAALDAVEDGQTIKVLADITEDGVSKSGLLYDAPDSRYTIDLNGFDVTLTGTEQNTAGIDILNMNADAERMLTLTDNSSGEAGTLTVNEYSDGNAKGIYTNSLTVSRITLVASGGGGGSSTGIYLVAKDATCIIQDGAVVTAKTGKTTNESWGIFCSGDNSKIIVDDAVLHAISSGETYSADNYATSVQPEDAQGNKLNPNEDPNNPDAWKCLDGTYGNNTPFVAVSNITGVPAYATVGTNLALTGTVSPFDATNRNIVWTVKDAGVTGASISGSTLNTTAAGTVTVTATITNGLTASSNYAQDFTITVSAPKTPSSIAVTTPPTQTAYTTGQTFDKAGMVVTATYMDSTTAAVSEYTFSPTTALATSDTTITISYTENGITVTTTQTITVTNAPSTHTITASASAGGSISPSGTVTVNNGESKTFTISANSNYSIASVTVDGVNQGTNSTYTFSDVTGNHTISATFSYNGGGGGSSSDRQAIWTSVPTEYNGGTKIIGNVRVPDYTVEGAWKKNADGTWNFSGKDGKTYADSWAPVFNPYADVTKGQSAFDWFKFDANGIMITGWHTDADGNTYYLNPTSDNTLGAMKTGWVLIDGKYYYFNEMPDGTRGKLFRNTTTPDGYLVDENGVSAGK